MLNLPSVTLCCIDTRHPYLAILALEKCLTQANFSKTILITCPDHGLLGIDPRIDIITSDNIKSTEDYSKFILKDLYQHIQSNHVLIAQWDGFITNANAWSDDFLRYDYIGAVWPQYSDNHNIGNGGFSLRSRKLLKALDLLDLQQIHPEDVCIGRVHREMLEKNHDIRFAPPDLAEIFSYEQQKVKAQPFGFHGLSNFADFMNDSELLALIQCAPAEVFCNNEGKRLIKALVQQKRRSLAKKAMSKRLTQSNMKLSEFRLWIQMRI